MKFKSFLRHLDLQWLRELVARPTRPIRRRSRRSLQLEALEKRDLFSASRPTILAVTPTNGSQVTTATPTIAVTFSEPMNIGDATTTSNYLLFGSAGNSILINSVTLTGPDAQGHETATLSYNNGAGLFVDTYTLFVRADQLAASASVGGLTIAQPGQVAVVNGGSDNVSIVNVPGDGSLSTVSQYALPSVSGTAPAPVAVAMGDLTGDGLNDLVILNEGTEQVDIFLGQEGGGYSQTPNDVLSLPTGDTGSSALILGKFSGSTLPDIVVANSTSNAVTAFQNQTTPSTTAGVPGDLIFGTGTDFAAGTDPVALAAADFDGSGKLDLAVGDGAVDASGNYDITILPGLGNASFFGAATTIPVGTAASGVIPDSLATGFFDAGNTPDLVAGGTTGAAVLLNHSAGIGNFAFYPNLSLTTVGIKNVAAGILRVAGASTQDDIAAVTSAGNQLLIFQNAGSASVGSASFTLLPAITVAANADGLAIAPLVPGGPNDILITQNNADANGGVSGQVSVLLNESSVGTTTFAAPTLYAVDGNPVGLAVGDTNQDGIPDVVTVNNSTNDFSLLLGNGDGTLASATNIALAPQPVAVAVADLTGNGIPDLIFAENSNTGGGNTSITVMLGNGSGGYSAGYTYVPSAITGQTFRDVVSLAVGDLTGNGELDIVALDEQDNTLGILLNNIGSSTAPLGATSFIAEDPFSLNNSGGGHHGGGGGVINAPTQILLDPFTPTSQQNGTDDILVAYQGSGGFGGSSGGVALVRNTTTANNNDTYSLSLPTAAIVSGIAPGGIVAASFNNAGNLDFAVDYNVSGSGEVAVYLGNDSGGFTAQGNAIPLHIADAGSMAVADLTGNGYMDIVVASQSTSLTAGGIDVLLNQLGSGFQLVGSSSTPVLPGTALKGITVDNLADSPFPDLIVTTLPGNGGSTLDNVFTLVNNGNGTFEAALPYLAGGSSSPTQAPSIPVVVSNPLLPVTTFQSGGTTVETNLIVNGNFGAPDLNGVAGSLNGWQTYNLNIAPGGSEGNWSVQTGTTSPLSYTTVAAPSTPYQAMLDEPNEQPYQTGGMGSMNPNNAASYEGTHALYQQITIPADATSVLLSMTLSLYNSASAWTDTSTPPALDYQTSAANQQVRVDIIDADPNDILTTSTTSGLLDNLFITTSTTPLTDTVTLSDINLEAYAGQTVYLRIAETNNQGLLIVGVDNVSVEAIFNDTTAPTISPVTLADPGYQDSNLTDYTNPTSSDTTAFHTTDTTLVGSVDALGGVNNIKYIEVDPDGQNFTSSATFTIGTSSSPATDPLGNFAITLPTPSSPGLQTVDIAVFDGAGNSASTTFTYFYQGPSLNDWQAYGPEDISTTGQANVNYTSVSGSITAIATDPADPTGNTYFVGTDNDGVWETTDGGAQWTPLTEYQTNSTSADSIGNPIQVPVGGLAVDPNNPDLIYAGTGVGNDQPDSQAGFGVLMSTNGGQTWTIAGDSGTVLGPGSNATSSWAGARVTDVVIGQNTDTSLPDIVYVAVASGGEFGPGVYESTDGGQTWTNMLMASNMTYANGSAVAAGTQNDSVTSLVIDPVDPSRLLVGLGYIGLPGTSASPTGGLWKTINNGEGWTQVVGGDGNVPNSTLPSGAGVGRVTVAIGGTDRQGDEGTVYVLIGTPPGNNTAPSVNYGTEYSGATNGSGLYVSTNNMLDFTDVMLEVDEPIPGGNPWNYQPLNLLGVEASNAGALVIDPSDVNVVYVGGSSQYVTNPTAANQFLIRVDTGDMIGWSTKVPGAGPATLNPNTNVNLLNDGDDLEKEQAALIGQDSTSFMYYDGATSTLYPYTGEGVYWYNIGEDAVNAAGKEQTVPNDIQALTFDSQGRLLIGTDEGIYRGVSLGYGYDFTSGGTGILAHHGGGGGGGGGSGVITPPGMTITSLNTNLQIGDITSVAIDPSSYGVLYTTQYDTGTAAASTVLSWTSEGLTGPTVNGTDLGLNTAGTVLTSSPLPGSPSGTPTTLFLVWQYANGVNGAVALEPESSTDSGQTYSAINSAGIPVTGDEAGMFPAFVVDPTPVLLDGLYENTLLLGTNAVYRTQTTGTVWDAISPVFNANAVITAVAYAPTNDLSTTNSEDYVYYAGENDGDIYVTTNDGGTWLEENAGLPANMPVNDIVVDPNNPDIAYALFGGGSTNSVFVTDDAGASWTNITNNLPNVSANSMVIVPIATGGETLYLATNVGVYDSTNGGVSWTRVGVGLPNVPVVDLQYNPTYGTLAAATEGAGVYTLSTETSGPYVTNLAFGSSTSTTSVSSVDVTFNTPINPSTFTPAEVTVTGPNGAIPVTSVESIDTVNNQTFEVDFAPQSAVGFYTVTVGPNITDLVGYSMYQNESGLAGENSNNTFTGQLLFYTPNPIAAPTLGNTSVTLPSVGEDGIGTYTGTVNLGSASFTSTLDITSQTGVQGIAITGINDSEGTWEYSQNGGSTWTNIPTTVSQTNALLLEASANNLIRYVPGPGFDSISFTPGPNPVVGTATFTFRAWDLTSGLTSPAGSDGGFADASSNGGTTAFSSQEGTASIDVLYVNHAPTFTPGPNQTILESAAASPPVQTVANWATNLSPGPANESTQTLTFIVTNNNTSLFAIQPTISANGTLTYEAAPDANGTATVSVELQDNGGTANGGQNTSAAQTFTITIVPVNQAPTFTPGPNETASVNGGLQTITNWATNIQPGPANQASETVTFVVSNSDPALFTVQPSISPNGTLTFTPGDTVGTATVTVHLVNSGSTANGGQNTSAAVMFTITITPVVTSGSADAVWLQQVYLDLLNRSATQTEINNWLNLLYNGTSRLTVAEEITSSTEYRTDTIQSLFNSYLGYSADSSGVNYYLQQFQQGATVEEIKSQILASPAFYQLFGGTNYGFLYGLYQDVLGLKLGSDAASHAFIQAYGTQLTNGTSRQTVALEVVQSPAAENLVVQAAYTKLLDRAPSSSDLTYWTNQLEPAPYPAMRDEVFIANVVASAEFGFDSTSQYYNSQPDQVWLNQVFEDTLGRAIDSNGLSYYIDLIRDGNSYPQIVESILSSQEYRSDEVTAAFIAILKRQPDPESVAYFVNYLNQGATIEQVKALMYASPEFYADAGGTNLGYLQALYQNALDRPLDEGGISYYGEQMATGAVFANVISDPGSDPVRESVALQVLTSTEKYQDVITAAYPQFLGRQVDPAGLTYWTTQFQGGMTDEQFYAQLMGSVEYYQKFA